MSELSYVNYGQSFTCCMGPKNTLAWGSKFALRHWLNRINYFVLFCNIADNCIHNISKLSYCWIQDSRTQNKIQGFLITTLLTFELIETFALTVQLLKNNVQLNTRSSILNKIKVIWISYVFTRTELKINLHVARYYLLTSYYFYY